MYACVFVCTWIKGYSIKSRIAYWSFFHLLTGLLVVSSYDCNNFNVYFVFSRFHSDDLVILRLCIFVSPKLKDFISPN